MLIKATSAGQVRRKQGKEACRQEPRSQRSDNEKYIERAFQKPGSQRARE